MPLITTKQPLIELPISDRTVGDTLIRRKARFQSLVHEQAGVGVSRTVVSVGVDLYAADGDDYGPRLNTKGFSSYTVEIATDNNTLVDVATGSILHIRAQEDAVAWLALANAYAQPVMFQSDYFEFLRDTHPIKIGDLIRGHIQAADLMGRFD